MPVYREEEQKYPSAKLGNPDANETAKKDRQYTASSIPTVAPAYNKGGYQVIPKSDLK